MRLEPNLVYTRTSPNQSARSSWPPKLIAIHSTESSHAMGSQSDLRAIANYFASSSSQASSHVITDADGNSARCVRGARKAWTQAGFNSVSLSIEQIGRAAQSAWAEAEYWETARWVAHWSKKFGIPIRRGKISGCGVTLSGVIKHKHLYSCGGGHVDPGRGYSMDKLLSYARYIRARI
jgi:hypothetical protein